LTLLALLLASVLSGQLAAVETLRSIGALPASIAGAFEEVAACHTSPEGDYIVFDRRAHTVWRVARGGKDGAKEIVKIGIEPGNIILPSAFASAPDGTFVVADAPGTVERVQLFFYMGSRLSGFTLPRRATPRIPIGTSVISGVGSLDYTGKRLLISDPGSGALISEYGLDGTPLRTFGTLRRTGHEDEADLHLALNSGYPLAAPDGGFYFVFVTGVPAFRKYNAAGILVYERHVEGPELDDYILTLPSKWPRRVTANGEHPLVTPAVRTAAVDPGGNLWLALVEPVTYVYEASGHKRRTVAFRGAGIISPTNLHFTRDGRLVVAPGCYTFNVK
jgi:hypothetical protein